MIHIVKKNAGIFKGIGILIALTIAAIFTLNVKADVYTKDNPDETPPPARPLLDIASYDAKLLALANGDTSGLWPAKAAHPLGGALLPFNRIVAYYGNLYSTQMGVLGQYPEDEMLNRLQAEVKKWETADPSTPVIPALHYIATVAQANAGKDGLYIARMPEKEIDKVLAMADKIHGLVFLDVQVAKSNLETEIPLLEKYLKMPNVHLGIDPEFSMKTGDKPGDVIGTFNANDINFVSTYLRDLVRENNLPPKILVLHRFTRPMITHYEQIQTMPEIQIVMDMDGWGVKSNKLDTYDAYIYKNPVQFTGFKLFYKNDVKVKGTTMFTPAELLKLKPIPSYIQYQ